MMNTRCLLVILSVAGFLLGLAAEPPAGEIYRWVDQNGVVSYSNVAPPDDETDVGIMEAVAEGEAAPENQDEVTPSSSTEEVKPAEEAVASQTQDAEAVQDDVAEKVRAAHKNQGKPGGQADQEQELTEEEMAKLEEASKDEHIKPKPLRKKYLTQRIEDTKRSIQEIQRQLQKRPDDEILQKSLTFKQEHLKRYVQAVETGNY